MVSLKNIQLKYAGPHGRGIGPLSMDVEDGECLGLLGPSGCGKSTLLKTIAGLLPRQRDYFDGKIKWNCDLATAPVGRRISLMFQQTVLLPHMTVLENVLLPFLGDVEGQRERFEDAKALLEEVGIKQEAELLPEALSGGMQTRVALARALIVRPKLLLLDEPFSGLDVSIRESAYRVIEHAQKRDRTTVMFVSHDLEESWRLCPRIAVMNRNATAVNYVEESARTSFRTFRQRVLELMNHEK